MDVVCRLSGWAVEANRLGLTWVRLWLKSEYHQRGDRFHVGTLATHYLGLLGKKLKVSTNEILQPPSSLFVC